MGDGVVLVEVELFPESKGQMGLRLGSNKCVWPTGKWAKATECEWLEAALVDPINPDYPMFVFIERECFEQFIDTSTTLQATVVEKEQDDED
jgi:hypothetical protein